MILNSFKHACDIFADVVTNDAEYSEAVRNDAIVKENLKPLLEPNEEFRYIIGFPEYVVTNFGKVINIKTLKVLKPCKLYATGAKVNRGNYYRYVVKLYNNDTKKQYYVHVLVANAFLDKPAGDDLVVNHINHDTSNNRVSNLEWITRSENSSDQITNRWTNYTLDELIALRKRCDYGTDKYNNLSKAIQYRRKKLIDGTKNN